jgi:group I intron endonuclease
MRDRAGIVYLSESQHESVIVERRLNYTVYRIRNLVNGRCYVGSTKSPETRIRAHYVLLRRSRHHSRRWNEDFKTFGPGSFVAEVLESDVPAPERYAREQHWMDSCRAYPDGYNSTPSAKDSTGYTFTPEQMVKVRRNAAILAERSKLYGRRTRVRKADKYA